MAGYLTPVEAEEREETQGANVQTPGFKDFPETYSTGVRKELTQNIMEILHNFCRRIKMCSPEAIGTLVGQTESSMQLRMPLAYGEIADAMVGNVQSITETTTRVVFSEGRKLTKDKTKRVFGCAFEAGVAIGSSDFRFWHLDRTV